MDWHTGLLKKQKEAARWRSEGKSSIMSMKIRQQQTITEYEYEYMYEYNKV